MSTFSVLDLRPSPFASVSLTLSFLLFLYYFHPYELCLLVYFYLFYLLLFQHFVSFVILLFIINLIHSHVNLIDSSFYVWLFTNDNHINLPSLTDSLFLIASIIYLLHLPFYTLRSFALKFIVHISFKYLFYVALIPQCYFLFCFPFFVLDFICNYVFFFFFDFIVCFLLLYIDSNYFNRTYVSNLY